MLIKDVGIGKKGGSKMGAWGEGTYDNNMALDYAESVMKVLHGGLESEYPEKVRVAAEIISGSALSNLIYDLDLDGIPTSAEVAIKRLKEIPYKWYQGWNDSEKVHAEIKVLIARLENPIKIGPGLLSKIKDVLETV